MKKLSKKSISHIYKKIIKVSGKPPRWLHEPLLDKNDKLFLNKCIESGYISSEGKFIDLFDDFLIQSS